ncbi:hypothetical protein [Rhizobium rhizogenes]|uniref:hypothetical protein n=1 Tax=Rhizobium rhizogenes TaxID=359 RepID=UPI0004D72EF8|nr:hypothetical protein [Rhizobium rhizogenes]KEA07477.1 hypothetical protein CN09_11250 [Rhizobium rhizogenes]NTJ22252.1 hypothetical protein [Rhizobium rhizogenes]QUE80970.1 hypothetical protein EML492_03930 [Rhizobium rhizogenes]TQO80925.1 hypothetical protein FFE80_07475 [Rhizobium rhizogenes]TRB51519.1 hypothetical protein EXN69_26360 [Rhizobium rhizogenes]
MANYLNLPTLAANFLGPAKTTFDVSGSNIDGGRNGVGESQSIEMSGGGLVTATYEDCKIVNPEQYEYVNWLGARFNGGFRFLNVPIITDWFGPFPKVGRLPTPIVTGIPHSDGSLFSDTSGYSQATVWGEITEAANLNAGVISMRVYGLSRPLRWSDWFSIYHATKGWRAYRYWDVLAVIDEENPVYTLALAPPLREAVSVGDRVEFARPRFVAKFKADFTLPSVVEAFFVTQQTIQFSEAF